MSECKKKIENRGENIVIDALDLRDASNKS